MTLLPMFYASSNVKRKIISAYALGEQLNLKQWAVILESGGLVRTDDKVELVL